MEMFGNIYIYILNLLNMKRVIFHCLIILILCVNVSAQAPACNTLTGDYKTICDNITEVMCKILALLQGIIAAIATLFIVWSGIKWLGSGEEGGVQARNEAKSRFIAVITGLVIAIVALNLLNYLFGAQIGTFESP